MSKLKEEIRKLNNKLFVGEWKVKHLRNHRRFKLQPQENNNTYENNTGPLPTLPSTGGTLLVHDRGNIYTTLKL